MNCVWDYVGFAIWFVGLGYIAMWPLVAVTARSAPMLTPPLHRGRPC